MCCRVHSFANHLHDFERGDVFVQHRIHPLDGDIWVVEFAKTVEELVLKAEVHVMIHSPFLNAEDNRTTIRDHVRSQDRKF